MSGGCFSPGIGPNCEPAEVGDGRQKDCLQKVIRDCQSQLNICMGKAKNMLFQTQTVSLLAPGAAGLNWELLDVPFLGQRLGAMAACYQSLECDFRACYCLDTLCVYCNGPGGPNPTDRPPPKDGGGGGGKDVDDNDPSEGPRLRALSFTTSTYERVIEQVYGTHVVTGNVFWTAAPRVVDRVKITIDPQTGVRRSVVEKVWLLDYALGLCEGQIGGVSRIWIGDQLIYSQRAEDGQILDIGTFGIDPSRPYNTDLGSFRIFDGGEGQSPPAIMGSGPGYRGLAYLLFEDFDVTTQNGAIPQMRVEVVRNLGTSAPTVDSELTENVPPQTLFVNPSLNRVIVAQIPVSNRPQLQYVSYDSLRVERTVAPTTDETYRLDSMLVVSDQFILIQDNNANTHLLQTIPAAELASSDSVPVYHPRSHVSVVRTAPTTSGFVGFLLTAGGLEVYRLDNSIVGIGSFPDVKGTAAIRHRRFSDTDTVPRIRDYLSVFDIGSNGITVKRFLLSDTDGNMFFDLAQTPVTITIPASAYGGSGNSIDAVWHSVSADMFYFIVGTTMFAWSSAVEWESQIVPLPFYNNNAVAFDYPVLKYGWIGTDNQAYNIDLTNGVVTPARHSVSGITGVQFFDAAEGSVTYMDEGAHKLYINHFASTPQGLDTMVAAILTSAGIPSDAYDVSDLGTLFTRGYKVNINAFATAVLNQIAALYSLHFFEQGGKIVGQRRAFGLITDIGPEDHSLEDDLEFTYADDFSHLLNMSISYSNPTKDYEESTQHLRKTQFLRGTEFLDNIVNSNYSWPVSMLDAEARAVCERILFEDDYEPREGVFRLGQKYTYLSPGDLIRMDIADDVNLILEILSITETADKFREVSVREIRPEVFTEVASIPGVIDPSGLYPIRPIPRPVAQQAIVFPVPSPFYQSLTDVAGFSAVLMVGSATLNAPSTVYYVNPTGRVLERGSLSEPVMVGTLVRPPRAISSRFSTDRESDMIIKFASPNIVGKLVAASHDDLFADQGRNVLFVGREIIQFMDFSVGPDNVTVTFRNLLRGLRATDDTCDEHFIGEVCAFYETTSVAEMRIFLDTEPDSQVDIGIVANGSSPDPSTFTPSPLKAWNRRAPAPTIVSREFYGPTSKQVGFRVAHRSYNQVELTDNGRMALNGNNTGGMLICILTAPFDPQRFDQSIRQLYDPANLGFGGSVLPDSTYIKRILRASLEYTAPTSWSVGYNTIDQDADGIDAHGGPLYVAAFSFDPIMRREQVIRGPDRLIRPDGYELTGRVNGFYSLPGETIEDPSLTYLFPVFPYLNMHPSLDTKNELLY